ncbi:MAG: GNAT family N-acetyltransferase [Chloroflexota bacterium]|nr:GNAT family N-acetyltransferase [Chloroflexota bacterium]
MNANAGKAVRIIPLSPTHADRIDAIARSLPAWFGIEEGLQDLRTCAERGPGLVALHNDTVTGFVTLAQPFPETWEITWMAVAPDHHCHDIGRALIDTVIFQARNSGARLLHVKTLADSHPSPEYAQTRAFYHTMGFDRLLVLPDLWGPANPCLLLVRPI